IVREGIVREAPDLDVRERIARTRSSYRSCDETRTGVETRSRLNRAEQAGLPPEQPSRRMTRASYLWEVQSPMGSSVPWGAPDVDRSFEARRAWRCAHAAGRARYRLKFHVHRGSDAPPEQDRAVQQGRTRVAACPASDQRGGTTVLVLDLIERLELNDSAAIWRRQVTVVCLPLTYLSLKNLAHEFVREVSSPEALLQRERGYPLREGHFDRPIRVAIALCHGGSNGVEHNDSSDE